MPPDLQRPPIFTVGQTDSYLAYMADCRVQDVMFLKKGMYDSYPGGIVFKTPADARRYINENVPKNSGAYSVFEIDADWGHDCYEQTNLFDECYWRYLISNRPIVCLVEDT